jgi:hypothetical protein
VQDGADLRLGKFKPGKGKKLVQLDKLTYQGKTKVQYEKEAIQKINDATLAGIRNGENASKKLHSDAKKQTEEQTTDAVGKLKDKFDATKSQVLAIVSNFGNIRSDLQELKNEYIQEQSQMANNYLQLDEAALAQADHKVIELQEKVALKQKQMQDVYENFQKMHSQL